MKKNETREETLERLARDASKGKGAAKSFERLVKRAATTPSPTAQAAEPERSNGFRCDGRETRSEAPELRLV
jgi:hypothetical protein